MKWITRIAFFLFIVVVLLMLSYGLYGDVGCYELSQLAKEVVSKV